MIIETKNRSELHLWFEERRLQGHDFTAVKGPAPPDSQDWDGTHIDWPLNQYWEDTVTGERFEMIYGPKEKE